MHMTAVGLHLRADNDDDVRMCAQQLLKTSAANIFLLKLKDSKENPGLAFIGKFGVPL